MRSVETSGDAAWVGREAARRCWRIGGLALLWLAAGDAAGAPFEVIAHRGASADAPENTLAAFESALAQGTEHLELDVRRSRDGAVMVFHDDDLARKTQGRGGVADHDAAALRRLDLAPWFRRRHPGVDLSRFPPEDLRVATLDQVFARFGARPIYHVEIKGSDPELVSGVVDAVVAAKLESRVRIQSFELEQLLRIRERGAWSVCWLLPGAREEQSAEEVAAIRRASIDRAQTLGVARVGVPADELDAALVEHARGRGVDVRVWKVRSLAALRRAHALGASGATVDWPGRALSWLRTLEGRDAPSAAGRESGTPEP